MALNSPSRAHPHSYQSIDSSHRDNTSPLSPLSPHIYAMEWIPRPASDTWDDWPSPPRRKGQGRRRRTPKKTWRFPTPPMMEENWEEDLIPVSPLIAIRQRDLERQQQSLSFPPPPPPSDVTVLETPATQKRPQTSTATIS